MTTQDDKLVDLGERAKLNETSIGKQNGKHQSSLGNDRRNLSGLKSDGTEGETNTGTDTMAPISTPGISPRL